MKNKIIISLLFLLPALAFGQTSKPVLQKQVEHLQDSLNRRADTAWVDSNFVHILWDTAIASGHVIAIKNGNGNILGTANFYPTNPSVNVPGLLSQADKVKIDGVATGADVSNNGYLSIGTGTGLSGSAIFYANQSTNSAVTIGIGSGYTLPTTTQVSTWNGKQNALGTSTGGKYLYQDQTWKQIQYSEIAGTPSPYALPTASASVLGGIKVGSRLSIASGILSADNMIQTLALAGNTLSISGGNSVTLPTVNDATISIKNGATTLGSFTTNQGTAGSIDISSAIPATPTLQQVSTSGNTTTNSLFFRLKTNSYYLDDAGNNRIFIGNATNANGIIFQNSQSTQTFQFRNSAATNVASIANDGSITSAALAGTGTRMVVTDASGNLAAQAIPVSQPNGFVKINSDYTVQSTDKDILIYSGSDSFVHITMPDPTTNTNRDLNIYINRQILNGTSPEYLDLYFDSYDYYFYAGGVGHYNLFENTNFAVYPHFRMFKLKSDGTHWYILNFPQDFNQ